MQFRLTKAVKYIAITCFAAFLVQQTADQFLGGNILSWFALIPYGFVVEHRFWELFTYSFLHADVMHLFFNLLMLVFIGSELEAVWGIARFLRYYFFCATAAGLLYLLLQLFVMKGEGLHMPMIGASGAIYGLLVAYGLIFGERVLLFMLLFPMKAKYFVLVLAGIELFQSVFAGHGGLSSVAHLGGMVAGFLYLWGRATWTISKRRRQQGPGRLSFLSKMRKRKDSKHLKLIINNDKGFDRDDGPSDDPKTWH